MGPMDYGRDRDMGYDPDHDRLMRDVALFKRAHPQVIIKKPNEVPSRKWEVSFPRSATIAFDDPAMMLTALSMISIPDDEAADA